MKQELLTENELRVMKPILESFPQYCPYEILLPGLFTNNVSPESIAHWHRRLEAARNDGTWQQELRPLRRTLSSLRSKLRTFRLEVSTIREMGCSLTSLTPTPSLLSRM